MSQATNADEVIEWIQRLYERRSGFAQPVSRDALVQVLGSALKPLYPGRVLLRAIAEQADFDVDLVTLLVQQFERGIRLWCSVHPASVLCANPMISAGPAQRVAVDDSGLIT
jgi:hypothetical protein